MRHQAPSPPEPPAAPRRGLPVGALGRAFVLGLLLACTTLGLGLLGLADASAQGKQAAPSPARTPEEQEALKMIDEDKLVGAKRAAEEILEKNPDSMVGNYVLGYVHHHAEGSLAQAMFRLGRARELYEKRWPSAPRPADAPYDFHRQLLFSIQSVAGEMEEYEYQLEILEYYDALYHPDLTAERAWPLLHLGRIDEARQYAKEAAAAKDPQQRSLGLNTLCALEGEAGLRKEYYEACLAAFENSRKAEAEKTEVDAQHESTLAVHAFNAAMAARADFRLEEAEKLALEGTRRLAFTPANPWQFLVRLYMDQGRMKDAIDALREMQRWRTRQPPNVRDQVRAETDVTFATALLVAAETETALRSVDFALERPDRRGMVSSSPEQALGAHALLRRVLLRTHGELLAEQAAAEGWTARLAGLWRAVESELATSADDERVVAVLGDPKRLLATLRPGARGGIEPVPPWLLGELVDVLGAGVVSAALREVRRTDKHEATGAYCDAIAAEVELDRGDEVDALKLAKAALSSLPKGEVLLRARVAALGSEAARKAGKPTESAALLEQAIGLDPGVVRRLGLRIPAKVSVQASGAVARRAGEMLESSPRIRSGERGFALSVEAVGTGDLQICLRGPNGTLLSCAQPKPDPVEAAPPADPAPAKPKKKLTVDEKAARLVGAFHRQALAMPLGLSGTDLSSLDGSTTVAEQAVRERLGKMLEDMAGGSPSASP